MVAGESVDVARRVDEQLGIVEEAAFFGEGPERLFGVLYTPGGRAERAVVICPAVGPESLATYSNDVALARALASCGIAAYRFHYRGTGHSDGDEGETSFETMRDDAIAAAGRLADEFEEEPVLMGTRLGGLVAASAAAEYGGGPLVLWAPVLEGRRFFREAWRASKVFDIREGPRTKEPTLSEDAGASFSEVLERDGKVDVLGYPISRAFYDSTVERTLLREAGHRGRRVLLVHGGADPSGEVDRTAAELRERGCDVDLETLPDSIVWWFLGPTMRKLARPQIAQLLERTLSWLRRLESVGTR